MSDRDDMAEMIDAMIDTFATSPFWEDAPIARACRDIAKRRGGARADMVRKFEAERERMEREAERARMERLEARRE